MNIIIKSNSQFSVTSIHYAPNGELCIELSSEKGNEKNRYQYTANLGNGQSEELPSLNLLEYTRNYVANSTIKEKSKDPYNQMARFLEAYGDCTIDKITTEYLQGFISHLQSAGLAPNTVRLYFQKITCVLNNAYKEGLFDERILRRVQRVKRPKEKKCFLTEAELKRMIRNRRYGRYDNLESMFLFSCMTGLRFGDVQGLKWKDVKHDGKHLFLEFHQHKTDTCESLPLCDGAESLLRTKKRSGEHVFDRVSNQWVNQVLKRWCRDSRIKKPVMFHTARHTFCVLLLTNDVPIFTVQQLMCHSDINTTKVYADLLNRTMSKAVKKMPLFEMHRQAV